MIAFSDRRHLAPLRQMRRHRRVAWGMALAAGLAVAAVTRPILGLIAWALYPLFERLQWWIAVRAWRARVSKASLPFLTALRALLEAGFSFPDALFRLSRASRGGSLGASLGGELAAFASGRTLGRCLFRFRRVVGGDTAAPWAWLCWAADKGLPLLPLVSEMIGHAELERDWEEKIRSLRNGAVAQAILAACLPWGLLGVVSAFDPEWLTVYWREGPVFSVTAACVIWQGVGLWIGYRESRFL